MVEMLGKFQMQVNSINSDIIRDCLFLLFVSISNFVVGVLQRQCHLSV